MERVTSSNVESSAVQQESAGESLGEQVFAALGYGIAAAGAPVALLRALTDDLGPSQFLLLTLVTTPLSLLGIRHRARAARRPDVTRSRTTAR